MSPPLTLAATGADAGTSAWEILVAAGLLIGLVAGSHQIVSALRRRGWEREHQRALELIRDSLDADDVQRELLKTRAEHDALRHQVDEELPREGRRAYLTARLEALGRQIDADVEEFEGLNHELTQLGGSVDVHPARQSRPVLTGASGRRGARRRPATDGVIAAVAALLLFIAVGPTTELGGFFDHIAQSATSSPSEVAVSVVTGGLLTCLVLLLLARFVVPSLHGTPPPRWLWAAVLALGVGATGALVLGGIESNRSTALLGLSDLRANDLEQTAAVLLGLGTLGAGAFAALLLCCLQLHAAASAGGSRISRR